MTTRFKNPWGARRTWIVVAYTASLGVAFYILIVLSQRWPLTVRYVLCFATAGIVTLMTNHLYRWALTDALAIDVHARITSVEFAEDVLKLQTCGQPPIDPEPWPEFVSEEPPKGRTTNGGDK